MTIRSIDHSLCQECTLLSKVRCPAIDSCAVDVLRPDEKGSPFIAYPEDCFSCFVCAWDCPSGAISVTPEVPIKIASIVDK